MNTHQRSRFPFLQYALCTAFFLLCACSPKEEEPKPVDYELHRGVTADSSRAFAFSGVDSLVVYKYTIPLKDTLAVLQQEDTVFFTAKKRDACGPVPYTLQLDDQEYFTVETAAGAVGMISTQNLAFALKVSGTDSAKVYTQGKCVDGKLFWEAG